MAKCDWEVSDEDQAVPHQSSPQQQQGWHLPQEAWPRPGPDAPPPRGVWEGPCCHRPSVWLAGVALCIYPLTRDPFID